MRAADEEHHVDDDHAAARVVRSLALSDQIAKTMLTVSVAFTPLIDPIFEYDRTAGRSHRRVRLSRHGTRRRLLRAILFADCITGRVWSPALAIDSITAEATASDLPDHTADLGGAPTVASLSSLARPDMAAVLGSGFQASGYSLTVSALAAGTWDIAVFAWSTVTGAYSAVQVVRVVVQ